MKSLNLAKKFLLVFTVKVLVLFNLSAAFSASHGDTIKPLTQVNKQFLVVAHIIHDENRLAGIDSSTIANQLSMASALFAPIGVSFTLCDVRHIYNFQFDLISRPGKNSEDLLSQYWVGKRINMFFPGTITDIIPGVCGFASLGGVTYNGQVGIVISKTLCPYTVSHELGHYFSLEHTFETSHGLELVNGSNCATAGDSICDTPADPYVTGSSYVNSNCTFTFTGKDTNGDYYDPDVSNIMSYYPDICACKFTHQQYEKMAKYFLSNPIEW